MDPRLKEIVDNFENMQIGLDDEFHFRCIGCGKCCTNREDILLNPKDVFQMAKHLGMQTEQFLSTYCEGYVGRDSRVYVVRLKPVGPNQRCPLQEGKLCKVHATKPVVCAMFPIGRTLKTKSTEKILGSLSSGTEAEIAYIYNPPNDSCRTNRKYTVRSWLQKFGIPPEDELFIHWSLMVVSVASDVRAAEEAHKHLLAKQLRDALLYYAYLHFDTAGEFAEQYKQNAAALLRDVKALKSDHRDLPGELPEEYLRRLSDGK